MAKHVISLAAALSRVANGGYQVEKGSRNVALAGGQPISSASITTDGVLLVRSSTGIIAALDTDPRMEVVVDHKRGLLVLHGPHKVMQQRKALDGGGMHTVEQIIPLLTIAHTVRHEAYDVKCDLRRVEGAERDRLNRENQKAEAAAKRHQEWEEQNRKVLGKIYVVFLWCDWRQNIDRDQISKAKQLVYDGRIPKVRKIEVDVDEKVVAISSTRLTNKQLRRVWDIWNNRFKHKSFKGDPEIQFLQFADEEE